MNGLLAALSPNEETTLRLIARGSRHPMGLRDSDVVRLQRLGLIFQGRTGLSLTETGRQRIEGRVADSHGLGGLRA
jgi:hypothetical protein